MFSYLAATVLASGASSTSQCGAPGSRKPARGAAVKAARRSPRRASSGAAVAATDVESRPPLISTPTGLRLRR